ncbi:uncharacterized protein SCHCODRAFT_02646125 [Schizophyllum commune H4-8]|uniref:Expressed protein n=1 Tax=Schizophyllum commune (strain H4-8 / FGSC 9210) TaxID=578458 RepID=D8QME6_SCHCM|nr:uncharacterized protein SCHCODRAFT_02646125 [Schizophyllum commune H4-8]KAI5836560.1 hypothetical protein SCHCODRAFT_02646125 [Schizophyllum commune H4-8]
MPSEGERIRTRLDAKKKQAPTPSKKSRSRKDAPGKENTSTASMPPTRAGSVTVPWRQKIAIPYTHQLLAIISEKTKYKIAFGFDKGAASLVPAAEEDPNKNNPTGLTQVDHAKSIARKLLLPTASEQGTIEYAVKDGELNGCFTEDHLGELALIIKARILALKRMYVEKRNLLGETGMGLIDNGREADMTQGSELKNKWDSIQKTFPYFKTLHNMMGSSPTVDRGAMANSTTPVDTSILGRGSQPFDDPVDPSHVEPSSRLQSTPLPDGASATRKRSRNLESDVSDAERTDGTSGGGDGPNSDSDSSMSSVEALPAAPTSKASGRSRKSRTPTKPSVAPSPAPASSHKRRQPIEVVAESAAEDRKARIDLAKYKLRKKNERAEKKARLSYEVELAKVKQKEMEFELRQLNERYAREEAERQRNFQREMMLHQLELERIRAGLPAASDQPAGGLASAKAGPSSGGISPGMSAMPSQSSNVHPVDPALFAGPPPSGPFY